jgi:hypothetical protein
VRTKVRHLADATLLEACIENCTRAPLFLFSVKFESSAAYCVAPIDVEATAPAAAAATPSPLAPPPPPSRVSVRERERDTPRCMAESNRGYGGNVTHTPLCCSTGVEGARHGGSGSPSSLLARVWVCDLQATLSTLSTPAAAQQNPLDRPARTP